MKKHRVDKRKILLVLPIVLLLLLGAGYYFLIGKSAEGNAETISKGINVNLPDAQFKAEKPTDKMGIYSLTESDSTDRDDLEGVMGRFGFGGLEDPQTRKINEKLAAIDKEINSPAMPVKTLGDPVKRYDQPGSPAPISKDVTRLENLMKSMQSSAEDDPEMQQLNSLMDKIIAVQNPELVMKNDAGALTQRPDSLFQAIPAVIARDQKAVQGSVVELRLLDTVMITSQLIPKGHSVFGLAEFSNQRLNLQIRNIRLGNQVIPVNLTVFDKRDAMQGINAPEALLTEAIGQGTIGAVSGIGITGFDLTTQIAGAGLDAAKGLLNKRVRRVKQKLKAGYPLLLRDNSRKAK